METKIHRIKHAASIALCFFVMTLQIGQTFAEENNTGETSTEEVDALFQLLMEYPPDSLGMIDGQMVSDTEAILLGFSSEVQVKAVKRLMDEMSDSECPEWTVRKLRYISASDARPYIREILIRAVNSEEYRTRISALQTIEALNDDEVTIRIYAIKMLNDQNGQVVNTAVALLLKHFSTEPEVIEELREVVRKREKENPEFITWREHYPDDLQWFQANYDYNDEELKSLFRLFTDGYLNILHFVENYADTGIPWTHAVTPDNETVPEESQNGDEPEENSDGSQDTNENDQGNEAQSQDQNQSMNQNAEDSSLSQKPLTESWLSQNALLLLALTFVGALLLIVVILRHRSQKDRNGP